MSDKLKNWIPDAGAELSYKAYPILLIRLFAGFTMFFAGFEKITQPFWEPEVGVWTAAGYLKGSAGGGIFNAWFKSLAGNGGIDNLVMWGELLIGLALILGFLVRFAAIMGIIENGLFWIAAYMSKGLATVNGVPTAGVIRDGPYHTGWATGPLELNAALIAMYIVMLLAGAGLVYGLDAYIQKTTLVKNQSWLKLLLG